MSERVVTAEEFAALSPRDRGWVVYMAGCREDQPNIPNEGNPYPEGTEDHDEWLKGQLQAVLNAQDGEE